jgi:hypothetical protein
VDEQKKSEASGKDEEQLGPYQLHEQVVQDELSHGELFRATHETSGATALVFKPAEDDAVPLTDWRVRCISSGSPGYMAMEVEQSAWAVAPDKYSAEALMCLFEDVRDGVSRMARAYPDFDEPRLRWRLGLALAAAAAVGALLFALLRPAPVSPPPVSPELLAGTVPAPISQEVPANGELFPTSGSLWGTEQNGGSPVLARPLPKKPYKGQRRPPCKPRVEAEMIGACWVPHMLTAPCPEDLYEHQGRCYTASMASPPEPRSLGH